MLQGFVSCRDSASHALPVAEAGVMMLLLLRTLLSPQVTGQSPQALQGPILQFSGGCEHPGGMPSFCVGWHGATSLRASSMQGLPLFFENCMIILLRSRTPKQVQLQSDQAFHSDSLQSTLPQMSVSLAGPWHGSHCCASPVAAMPQLLACRSWYRWRHLKPVPHVAEHSVQRDHSLHSPSMQAWSQGAVLHGLTSCFGFTSQSRPPFLGATATCLVRCFVPPPQLQVQALQLSHSSHLQSSMSSLASLQAPTSSRSPRQPLPVSRARCATSRVRLWKPSPSVTEQADHPVQSVSSQSSMLEEQGSWLHGWTSWRWPPSHLPPCLAAVTRSRFLKVWPPPHTLSQSDHEPQFATTQSLAGSDGQPRVSCMWPAQPSPSPTLPCLTSRVR
mmetsp:Transcript_12160/g.36125  ORF Transcript_12160/g.36125 Transcript_12160/m.36125 type:complete len:389 (+) Transcript_12160:2827-3993(+)